MRVNNTRYSGNMSRNLPTFKASIHIVDNPGFDRVVKEVRDSFEVGRTCNHDWLLSESAIKKSSAFTKDVSNCVGGVIINPKTKLLNMFHLSPYRKNMTNIDYVRNEIFHQAEALKGRSSGNLEGLIFGGNSCEDNDFVDSVLRNIQNGMFLSLKYDYEEYQSAWNIELLRAVRDTFAEIAKKIGLDYSVIAGRKGGSCVDVLSDARTNSHYLNVRSAIQPLQRPSDLDRIYETKVISPRDKIDIFQPVK